MIVTFNHKGLEDLFEQGRSAKILSYHFKKLNLILAALNSATEIADMNLPGLNLHRLKGKLENFWSIKITGNWRVIFRFYDGSVYDVDYLDYH